MEAIVGRASVQEVVDEAEANLSRRRPVDLSSWVMDDLPSHEAHFIDDRTDLIRAMLISLTLVVDPKSGPLRMEVGSNLTALRERVLAEVENLAADAELLELDYGISQSEKRLGAIRSGLRQAYGNYEKQARDRLRAAEVDLARATDLIRSSLLQEWSEGFPRNLLAGGEVRNRGEWRTGRTFASIRRLELKEFFTKDGLEQQTMEMFGTTWARAFLAAEESALFEKLSSLPARSWHKRGVRARLSTAIERLPAATHLVVPFNWRLRQELFSTEPRMAIGQTGTLGTLDGVAVHEASEATDSMYLLALPSALRTDQWLFSGETFRIEIREMDTELTAQLLEQGTHVPGEESETAEERLHTRVLTDIRECFQISLSRESVIRIALPDALLD
jgi:hypothetical protein